MLRFKAWGLDLIHLGVPRVKPCDTKVEWQVDVRLAKILVLAQ